MTFFTEYVKTQGRNRRPISIFIYHLRNTNHTKPFQKEVLGENAKEEMEEEEEVASISCMRGVCMMYNQLSPPTSEWYELTNWTFVHVKYGNIYMYTVWRTTVTDILKIGEITVPQNVGKTVSVLLL